LFDAPDQREFGRMAMQTKQVRKTARPAPNDSRGVPRPTSQVLRFERQSVLMAVSSGFGQPEVEGITQAGTAAQR